MNNLPTNTYDEHDPGDDMQLRIRYQYAYGIVLFCAAANGIIPCRALWFEQKDDILLEKENQKFDFFQVKTRDKTLGKWRLSDAGLRNSLKRFCSFESTYGPHVDSYVFVSNCPYKKAGDKTKGKEKCPINFFSAIKDATSLSELDSDFRGAFEEIASSVDIDKGKTFSVFKRVQLVVGPELESFELDISATHLHSLSILKSQRLSVINRIRDEYIQKIFYASSLSVEDPYKHIFCQIGGTQYDPRVVAKRINLEEFKEYVAKGPRETFSYFRNSAELEVGSAGDEVEVLRAKLVRAGLGAQFEATKRRSLSSEAILMEDAIRDPESFQQMLDQLEGTVLTTCSDAILAATNGSSVDGVEAFRQAVKKLEQVATNCPEQVVFKGHDLLIGVAGLLTGSCKLWWSEQFDLEDVS